MTIFGKISKYFKRIWGGFEKDHPETAKALEKWAEQFTSELGSLVADMALTYGLKLAKGDITIATAKDEILAKLKAEGKEETDELVELIFNALRTAKTAA